MNKEQLAVLQGIIISVVVAAILTTIWAAIIHIFPNLWGWLKTLVSFLNYSFALYIGVLSASLRTKAYGINAPLYVMLAFFGLTLFLRIIFVTGALQFGLTVLKFIYSVILLAVAFKHAQVLMQGYTTKRRYGRLH